MRIFITGAASPLGRTLTGLLTRRGDQVVGQVRRLGGVAVMRNLGAEPVVGDIRRPESLAEAMAGCDAVFHLAGYFDFWQGSANTFEEVNVLGTRHALAAAIVAGVRRVIVCSSAVTIGEMPGEEGDEWTRHRGYTVTQYERSKLEAERLALRLREKGLEVVVVNPALVVAPADSGWTGRLIESVIAGRRRFASTAPAGWVWVADAVEGLARALDVGKDGERYILCGDTLSPLRFLTHVAELAGVPAPHALPAPVALGGALLSSAIAYPRKRRPSLPPDEARFAATGFAVDGSHATYELGVHYTPVSVYLPTVVQSYRSALQRFAS